MYSLSGTVFSQYFGLSCMAWYICSHVLWLICTLATCTLADIPVCLLFMRWNAHRYSHPWADTLVGIFWADMLPCTSMGYILIGSFISYLIHTLMWLVLISRLFSRADMLLGIHGRICSYVLIFPHMLIWFFMGRYAPMYFHDLIFSYIFSWAVMLTHIFITDMLIYIFMGWYAHMYCYGLICSYLLLWADMLMYSCLGWYAHVLMFELVCSCTHVWAGMLMQ